MQALYWSPLEYIRCETYNIILCHFENVHASRGRLVTMPNNTNMCVECLHICWVIFCLHLMNTLLPKIFLYDKIFTGLPCLYFSGSIADFTGSFDASFYFSGVCFVIGGFCCFPVHKLSQNYNIRSPDHTSWWDLYCFYVLL